MNQKISDVIFFSLDLSYVPCDISTSKRLISNMQIQCPHLFYPHITTFIQRWSKRF